VALGKLAQISAHGKFYRLVFPPGFGGGVGFSGVGLGVGGGSVGLGVGGGGVSRGSGVVILISVVCLFVASIVKLTFTVLDAGC
jgi:hypothetical protein